jgi:DDE superfamily endonuclease
MSGNYLSDSSSDEDDSINDFIFNDEDADNEGTPLAPNILNVLIAYATIDDGERLQNFIGIRLDWNSHVQNLLRTGTFRKMYRMSFESFTNLCSLLEPFLIVDKVMSKVRTNQPVIGTEIIVSSFIRWLSAGSFHDLAVIAVISIASFYRVMDRCARAILDCDALAYSFPTTPEEIKELAEGFEYISTNKFITGCVGAVDGLLLRIKVPATIEVGMVTSIYSGHYQCYGINIHAVCDHRCCFTEVCVAAPGGANDIAAFRKTIIPELINNLPVGNLLLVITRTYVRNTC